MQNLNSSNYSTADQIAVLNRDKERKERKQFYNEFERISQAKLDVMSIEYSP